LTVCHAGLGMRRLNTGLWGVGAAVRLTGARPMGRNLLDRLRKVLEGMEEKP